MKHTPEGPIRDSHEPGGSQPDKDKEIIGGTSYSPYEVPDGVRLNELTGEVELDREQYREYMNIAEGILHANLNHRRVVIDQYDEKDLFHIGIMLQIIDAKCRNLSEVVQFERKSRVVQAELENAKSLEDVIVILKSYSPGYDEMVSFLETEGASTDPKSYFPYKNIPGLSEALIRVLDK